MHHLLSLLCRLYCFLLAPSAAHYINGGPSLPPPLTPEQEKALLTRMMAGDAAARDDLITHNLRLEHTHTDKTLQGNDKIESAIAALQHEPSQEMLAHVLTVIRRRMNEHGELIIAVDPSSAASGLQVQAIQTDDGRKWWAAFTSFDEELKGSGSVMSTFLTDMKQLFNSAITADNIQGIIINPWNRTIMLDKALLRIILGEISI